VPVRLREIRVLVDRPGFTLNPTSCAEKQIGVTVSGLEGSRAEVVAPFRVGDCGSLAFRPRLAMRLTGRGRTRTGAHPGLSAVLTQGRDQANVARARVALPRSVVLDPRNSTDPRLICDYDKALVADCAASSIIGRATAVTPLLDERLVGNVHLVQGIRFGSKGNRIRTLPTLLVKLRGRVAIDLRGETSTSKNNRLVTTFPAVPDAPVSKFSLRINGGKKGILAVTRTAKRKLNLCSAPQIARVVTGGQNGKRADFATRIKTPCAKSGKRIKRGKRGR
jgi:hypothetical protein